MHNQTNLEPRRSREITDRAVHVSSPLTAPPAGLALDLDPRGLIRGLAIFVFALIVVGAFANVYIYHISPDPYDPLARAMRRFDLGHEPSIPALYSSLALFASAILLATIGVFERRKKNRYSRHWFGLSAIFVLLSVDETVMFHEMLVTVLRDRFDTHGILYFPWVIPGAIFVVVVALVYANFLRRLDRRTSVLFLVAGGMFVGGAIGMELIAGVIIEANGVEALAHTVSQTIEETLEMAGILVFLYALLDYVKRHIGWVRIQT